MGLKSGKCWECDRKTMHNDEKKVDEIFCSRKDCVQKRHDRLVKKLEKRQKRERR